MSEEEENFLFSKCLEFSRSLLDKDRKFTFEVNTSSGFTFSFSNLDSGKPEEKLMKRKKTPSQLKRNKKRMEIFNSKKAKEVGKPESLTEYELKMEAHVNCTKCWDPKDGELCLARLKSGETQSRSSSDPTKGVGCLKQQDGGHGSRNPLRSV